MSEPSVSVPEGEPHEALPRDLSLFHYTTESGLYGILKSQQLWATHFAHMNDCAEMRSARSMLKLAMNDAVRERIKPFLKERKEDGAEFEEACIDQSEVLVDAYYMAAEKIVAAFISSFCSHEGDSEAKRDGLLSQWRGYGVDGGFAIELGFSELDALRVQDSSAHSHNGYYITPVVYGDTSKDFPLLKEDIGIVTDVAFRVLLHNLKLGKDLPAIEKSYLPFMRCTTRFKHPGFREEQEIRVVYIRQQHSAVPEGRRPLKPIEFRKHRGGYVPYVQLFGETDQKLPIKRIIVGPHPRSELRRKAIDLFLRQEGIAAEVHISAIPYLPE
jgi:hypothetical protein